MNGGEDMLDHLYKNMNVALEEAVEAFDAGEVPVGAIIVKEGKIISRAHNIKEEKKSPLMHAEIDAINKACINLGDWRLADCEIYVTMEPCIMCAGAIINARIKRLYYGAFDMIAGADGGLVNIFGIKNLTHHVEVYGGIMEKECRDILGKFFRQVRNDKRYNKEM